MRSGCLQSVCRSDRRKETVRPIMMKEKQNRKCCCRRDIPGIFQGIPPVCLFFIGLMGLLEQVADRAA